MRVWLILPVLLGLVTGAAQALDLALPGNARLTGEVSRNPDSYLIPVAPFANGVLPVVEIEGGVRQQAWRLEQPNMTTLQMIRPLREQLSGAGYDIVLDCGGPECGGFDFRFNTRVMAAPDMYVDLFDFRFLTARKPAAAETAGDRFVSVLVSKSGGAGYIQVIHVTPGDDPDSLSIAAGTAVPAPAGDNPDPVVQNLTTQGHVILRDLDFATGSATLGDGRYGSLAALAAYLLGDERRRIALVGHTDGVGSLADNVALSRKRAASVLNRLVEAYEVPRDQVDAEGVGYLSPIAPNQTAAGREANRRVEAVLLSAE